MSRHPRTFVFAQTNYRNQMRKFGIKTDDAAGNMCYGKTGMGKTTMLENMVLHDDSGHGASALLIRWRLRGKSLILFLPIASTMSYILIRLTWNIDWFNILEVKSEEQKHLVAAGLMGIFKNLAGCLEFAMEYILNTLLSLLSYPGSTPLELTHVGG